MKVCFWKPCIPFPFDFLLLFFIHIAFPVHLIQILDHPLVYTYFVFLFIKFKWRNTQRERPIPFMCWSFHSLRGYTSTVFFLFFLFLSVFFHSSSRLLCIYLFSNPPDCVKDVVDCSLFLFAQWDHVQV